MIRRIIHIDEEKCNGCGACADACHESAIGMVDGKAKLLRDDYCDGLGDCLPTCPTGAITFVEREAAAYDEAAVLANQKAKQEKATVQANTQSAPAAKPVFSGCPGSRMRTLHMKGKITIIGCPKLDAVDYSEKLTEIIAGNDIKSVTVLRMEVPCCGGLEQAAITALKNSGKFIPWQVVTCSIDGKILE